MKLLTHLFTAALALAIARPATAQGLYPLQASLFPGPTAPQAGAQHGKSVAVDAGYLVVGAPLTDVGGFQDSGAALVYDAATGALVATLNNPSPAASDLFGFAVAVSGSRVVVGAYQDDTGATNSGSAYVYDLAGLTPTTPVHTLTNPTPAVNDNFGRSVAISGNRVVVGAHLDNTGATDAGSAYVYDLASATPTTPLTLNNPGPAVNDVFGISVAVSGDRVVVGAFNDDTGATDAGSAYIYDLASATPTVPVTTLNNPSPAATDNFGTSVAISGNRVVVGADLDDAGATNAGSAYVYDLASATPTTPLTLPNPTPAVSDEFGFSVAISGPLVVICAYSDNTGGTDAGSIYVYDLGSATPTVPVTFNNPALSGQASDFFGESVAVSGSRVAAGAAGTDNSGAAYLFDAASATPTVPVATVRNPLPPTIDYFGGSVAASGNLLVVGADHDDRGATDSGVAYVYDLESAAPTAPLAVLTNPSPASSDAFGYSVAVSGSIVVVGADYDDTGATDSGTAYVYDLASATPTVPMLTLNNPSPATSDNFGAGVAVAGNIVVVGAYLDDTGATNAGTAYVYNFTSATPTAPVLVLNNPSPASNDQFGWAVAVSGNLVVVGANQDDTGATDAGLAYVYDLSSATPTVPVATLNNPTPAAFDRFAYTVAISGSLVAVGAPLDDTGASDAGSAYVYDLASATPTVPVATLNNPSPAATEYFGGVVAISGSRVVAGSYSDDTGGSDAGSAFVYDLASATPTVPVTLSNPAPAAFDYFGWSVAITASRVIVGAPLDDTLNNDEGAAYVFGAPVGPPAAEIAVEQPTGMPLADGTGSVSFGMITPPAGSARTFTIRNIGTADLTGLGIVIDGTNAAEFTLTAAPTAPVSGPSGSTTFTITFTPGSAGAKTAALHLASNDTDENPFDIALTGTGLTRLESWRLTYFGSTANSGAGADGNDFDRDGPVNLLEFATHRDPTQPGGAIDTLVKNGAVLEFNYSRAKAAVLDGLLFTVEWSDTLAPGSWSSVNVSESILTDDGIVQAILATLPAGPGNLRFVRLRVDAP